MVSIVGGGMCVGTATSAAVQARGAGAGIAVAAGAGAGTVTGIVLGAAVSTATTATVTPIVLSLIPTGPAGWLAAGGIVLWSYGAAAEKINDFDCSSIDNPSNHLLVLSDSFNNAGLLGDTGSNIYNHDVI